MLLDVTFAYEAEVLAPRKRRLENKVFLATIPVEIDEIPSAGLPVAFRFDERQRWDDGKGVAREVRWSAELGHWQADLDVAPARDLGPEERPATKERDAAWLAAHSDPRLTDFSRFSDDPFRILAGVYGNVSGSEFIEGNPNVVKVGRTNRDEREAEVRAAIEAMLIVDGVLHERTTEPVFNIRELRTREGNHGWAVIERAGDHSVKGRTHFRADEAAAVEAMVSGSGNDVMPAVEVLIPEAVRAPLPEMDVVEAAELLMARMAEDLKKQDRAFFLAYADLRDSVLPARIALANLRPGRDEPPPVGDVSAAIQAALPLAAAANEYGGWFIEIAQNACARYDARQLGMDLDAAPAPRP